MLKWVLYPNILMANGDCNDQIYIAKSNQTTRAYFDMQRCMQRTID